MDKIFKDLVVVELATVLAGPAVGMFFAELGAKVIKVENPITGGDITRQWRLPNESVDRAYSAYYCSINYGKEICFLNLKDFAHRNKLYELIKTADIILTNYTERVAKKLQLSIDVLHNLNPQAIISQLYAYEKSDPRPGFDVLMQAESGFLSMTGAEINGAAKIPVALIDLIAGHQLKEALLTALWQREKDKKARFIELSLYKSAIASLANQASNYLMENYIPKRMGTKHPNIAPYGDLFSSKDGLEGVLAIGSDQQFTKLATILKFNQLEKSKYQFNQDRVKLRDELMVKLHKILGKKSKCEIAELFEEHLIPHGWINSLDTVFEEELAKEMILSSIMADGGEAKCVRSVAFTIKEFDA